MNPDILRRIELVGVLDRVKTSQTRGLTALFDNARIGRLIEQEAIDGAAAYRTPVNNDSRAFIRGDLTTLKATIIAALARTPDRATQFHLEDARDQITKILDPKFERPVQGGLAQAAGNGVEGSDNDVINPEICFPDYAIRLVP